MYAPERKFSYRREDRVIREPHDLASDIEQIRARLPGVEINFEKVLGDLPKPLAVPTP